MKKFDWNELDDIQKTGIKIAGTLFIIFVATRFYITREAAPLAEMEAAPTYKKQVVSIPVNQTCEGVDNPKGLPCLGEFLNKSYDMLGISASYAEVIGRTSVRIETDHIEGIKYDIKTSYEDKGVRLEKQSSTFFDDKDLHIVFGATAKGFYLLGNPAEVKMSEIKLGEALKKSIYIGLKSIVGDENYLYQKQRELTK